MSEEEDSSDLDIDTLVPLDDAGGWVKFNRELARMNTVLTASDYEGSSLSSKTKRKRTHQSEHTKQRTGYKRKEPRFNEQYDVSNDQDYYGDEAEQEETEDITEFVNEDERLDAVRVQTALDMYKQINNKIREGTQLNPHEIKLKKLFSVDKTYDEKATRMTKDRFKLTFQNVLHENDRRILKALGKDPGQEVCFGCMCPPGDDPTDNESDMRMLVDMYFRVWSNTDDIPLAKNISQFANENVLPNHRKMRKQNMMSDPETSHLTDEQMDALLPQCWSPASVYAHFNFHTPNPMAVWCREFKRLLVVMKFLWEDGIWMADVLGTGQKDEINLEKFRLYVDCQKRLFELQKIKPESWMMPDIHSHNLIKAQGIMSRRVTVVPANAKLYNL